MKIYKGMCDGSAGQSVDENRFLVGNDETEIINLYSVEPGGSEAIAKFDFTKELRGESTRECDIEGSAAIDDLIFWVTSHGRNKKGKMRPNRYRLFATQKRVESGEIILDWKGRYDDLAGDMCELENWQNPEDAFTKTVVKALQNATRLNEHKVKSLAPKKNGLNIEGLAVSKDKSHLLLGLRNPIVDGKAIIIPLLNPHDLVLGNNVRAEFDTPIGFDFNGNGIRSIGFVEFINEFLIIAGPAGNGGPFKLFRWSGHPEEGARPGALIKENWEFSPEAIVTYGDSNKIQILGDGGNLLVSGEKCKERPENERYFMDDWIELNAP